MGKSVLVLGFGTLWLPTLGVTFEVTTQKSMKKKLYI